MMSTRADSVMVAGADSAGGSSTTSGSSSDSGSSISRAWKDVREIIELFDWSVAMAVSDQRVFVTWPCDEMRLVRSPKSGDHAIGVGIDIDPAELLLFVWTKERSTVARSQLPLFSNHHHPTNATHDGCRSR